VGWSRGLVAAVVRTALIYDGSVISRLISGSPLSPSEKPRLASGLRCGGGGHGARATGLPLCRRALCRGTGAGSKP
jgi:hypothetical protein